jgi:uncharacterized membrane-anchored protein YitT (DUF2179 family)
MQVMQQTSKTKLSTHIIVYFFMAIGAFLAAFAIQVFLIPNRLIDGGTVGLAMICGNQTDTRLIPLFLIFVNLPFVILAYRTIGKTFVMHMVYAVIMFALSMVFIHHYLPWAIFYGETLEVVVIGGAILGVGQGLVIRYGGSTDGTEILGIIINRRTGFTVGQVVLFCNVFIFGLAGVVFQDWHPPLLSLITYMVVIKIMDSVIVGLDEVKSVMIISAKSKAIAEAIMHELGLGLTVMYGRGGFSGDEREILYVIAERLQLADLKELIHQQDPAAFVAIENLHEVAYGKQNNTKNAVKKTNLLDLFKRIVGKTSG